MTDMSLLETSYSAQPKVDRESNVIRNVKVLGRTSRNGRVYSDKALDEAVGLYGDISVNFDHPDRKTPERERLFEEGLGWLTNARRDKDGVYADLNYYKSHPLAEMVCEAAERAPNQLGLSHNANGPTSRRGGRDVVESITKVISVDVVRRPATNKSLFESEGSTMKLEEFLGTLDKDSADRQLLETFAEGEVDIEIPSDADTDQAMKSVISKLLEGDGQLIPLLEKAAEKPESATSVVKPEASMTPDKASAVKTLQEQVDGLVSENERLKAERAATELLESASIEPTPTKILALVRTETQAERESLIEEWPTRDDRRRPAIVSAYDGSEGYDDDWKPGESLREAFAE